MPGWRNRGGTSALRWLFVGLAVLWAVACAFACAKPNPLAGKWQGENSALGKTVYWEFMPDGRLFTDNFAGQQKFRYRIEQPDLLYISFFGNFEADTSRDELVYRFRCEGGKLWLIVGDREDKYLRAPDS